MELNYKVSEQDYLQVYMYAATKKSNYKNSVKWADKNDCF